MASVCSYAMTVLLFALAPKVGDHVTIHASKAKALGYTERDIPQGLRCCREKRIHCRIDWNR